MSSRKHERKWAQKRTTAGAALALGCCMPVAALALGGGGDGVFTTAVVGPPPGCAAPGMKSLEPTAETVKGAPYSGVGTTEVVTTLADGNRITRTNTMHYFRDSAGRMRTEYQLAAIGPFVPEESQSIVTITDPVAGKRYVLHPSMKRADVFDLSSEKGAAARTEGRAILMGGVFTNIGAAPAGGVAQGLAPSRGLRVMPQRSGRGSGGGMGAGGPSMIAPGFAPTSNAAERGVSRSGEPAAPTSTAPAGPTGDVLYVTAGPAGMGCGAGPNGKPAPQAVSIGERRIEGLKVTGSRLEFTIGAGEVGNEQPITVRTDQWFSPDLQVVVSSTHNDPMIGETTYRLEQINRAEPDPGLFTVPTDYTKSSVER
jgi:hypothetical protein